MRTSNGCDSALGFWSVGINYLHLVEIVANETVEQGNPCVIVSREPITEQAYDQETKWSDYNLVIPLLFNFYHGIELILKGFLCVRRQNRNSHNLSHLLSEFEEEFPDSHLLPLFEKYIKQNKLPILLSEFCEESSITIDQYYQALKYPEGSCGEMYQHFLLKYQGRSGVCFFGELKDDIKAIREKCVSLGRKICPKHR